MVGLISLIGIPVLTISFFILANKVIFAVWKPLSSDMQVRFLGMYLPLLTRLKYHRFARTEFYPETWKKVRARLLTALELILILAWALWLGRAFLVADSTQWLRNDWTLNVQSYFAWGVFKKCGVCVLWDGLFNGGAPLFVDLLAAMAHPLVILLVLLAGAVNGTKLIAVAGLILAGIAQWWWAKVLRLGLVARIWSAAMAVVGGFLAGRLENGLSEMVLSIASISLIIPPAIRLAQTRDRRMAVAMGLLMGCALLTGQGYMQLGLIFALVPAFLVLMLDEKFKLRPVWKEFLLAGVIAILVTAFLWVPVAHIFPHFTKPNTSPDFVGTQPIDYQPLNLLIHDVSFFYNSDLQKAPYPNETMTYIGWVPILLAVLAIRLVPRSGLRLYLYFCVSILLIYLTSSALIIQWLNHFLPDSVVAIATMARYPNYISCLAGPFLLGMAAWGLDLLLRLKWPSLTLSHQSGLTVSLNLVWIMVVPLALALLSAYNFVKPWLEPFPMPVNAEYYSIVSQIKPSTVEWVEPPGSDWGFQIVALDQGMKLTNTYHLWSWKDRTPPPPTLQATEDKVDPSDPHFSGSIAYISLRSYPENYYAYVDTGKQQIPCQAHAQGGNIDVVCKTDTPGQLVVRENLWSGWTVKMDGAAAALEPGQWLTTHAPAGSHRYAFRFRPWDVLVGGTITLLGLALSLGLWFHRPANTTVLIVEKAEPEH